MNMTKTVNIISPRNCPLIATLRRFFAAAKAANNSQREKAGAKADTSDDISDVDSDDE